MGLKLLINCVRYNNEFAINVIATYTRVWLYFIISVKSGKWQFGFDLCETKMNNSSVYLFVVVVLAVLLVCCCFIIVFVVDNVAVAVFVVAVVVVVCYCWCCCWRCWCCCRYCVQIFNFVSSLSSPKSIRPFLIERPFKGRHIVVVYGEDDSLQTNQQLWNSWKLTSNDKLKFFSLQNPLDVHRGLPWCS